MCSSLETAPSSRRSHWISPDLATPRCVPDVVVRERKRLALEIVGDAEAAAAAAAAAEGLRSLKWYYS